VEPTSNGSADLERLDVDWTCPLAKPNLLTQPGRLDQALGHNFSDFAGTPAAQKTLLPLNKNKTTLCTQAFGILCEPDGTSQRKRHQWQNERQNDGS
jgi:hypothetical protein